jgi:hypothetical protein
MGLGNIEVTAKNVVKSILLVVGSFEDITELINNKKSNGIMINIFPMSLQTPTYEICKEIEQADNHINNITIGQSVEKCHCYMLMSDMNTSNVLIGIENDNDSYILSFPFEDHLNDGDDLLNAAINGFTNKTGIKLSKQQEEDIELFSMAGTEMDTIIFICRL